MNKTIYIALSLVTVGLLGYTGFYTFTQSTIQPEVVVATSAPIVIEEIPAKNILTTKTGKTISVVETNPNGESMSNLRIIPRGFENTTEILLEKNKLTDFFLIDMNSDGYDELVIITTSQGSGNYGEITLFTTTGDKGLALIETPQISEDLTKKGGLFEGYLGHDIFSNNSGILLREFPTHNASDTNNMPTGLTKKIVYTLGEIAGKYSITLTNENKSISPTTTTASILVTSSSSQATSSKP